MLCISKTNNENRSVLHFGQKNFEKLLTMLLYAWKKPKLAPLLGRGKCHLYHTHHSDQSQLHFPDDFSSCHFLLPDLSHTSNFLCYTVEGFHVTHSHNLTCMIKMHWFYIYYCHIISVIRIIIAVPGNLFNFNLWHLCNKYRKTLLCMTVKVSLSSNSTIVIITVKPITWITEPFYLHTALLLLESDGGKWYTNSRWCMISIYVK